MGIFDLFRKKPAQVSEPDAPAKEEPLGVEIYSGMRVEVTAFDGRLLFVAKMMDLRGTAAELYQYSETESEQEPDQDAEPIRVRIRGYHDHEKKAIYMEGAISPRPKHIWHVEDLTVTKIGNDRAFFRLDTKIDATAITFGGLGAGERPCKLLNISVGGACITSEHQYHEKDRFLLKVRLLEDREPSAMFCQVLRVIEKADGQVMYGCQFLELNEADEARITQNIFAAQRRKRRGA